MATYDTADPYATTQPRQYSGYQMPTDRYAASGTPRVTWPLPAPRVGSRVQPGHNTYVGEPGYEPAGGAAASGRDKKYPKNRRQAAVQQTLDQLMSILSQNGGTDPGRLNYQMTDIARGTESGQNAFDEYLASQGLSGSGVGAATHAAIGEAGQERRGQAIADENARAEERRRQDLLLTLQLILNPRLTRRGQDKAIAAAAAGGKGGGANWMGMLGGLAGGASGTDWSKMGGGGTGTDTGSQYDNNYDYGADPESSTGGGYTGYGY